MKTASKKERGLLKNASEWCKAFMTIRELLVDLDIASESSNQEALSNTMQRIALFIESRHTVSKANTAKLGVAQSKAVATKLEASVLKQRQLAKQLLEDHARHEPVRLQETMIVETNPHSSQGGPSSSSSNSSSSTRADAPSSARN